MDIANIQNTANLVRAQIHRVVVGQDEAINLLLVAALCEGHILFEGVPGVAKTLLAKSFAGSMALGFGRVQFTPDLMPGDILGTNLFNFQTNQFTLTRGPIFTEIMLADEINRTPPKTQAALLQAMQERAVTIDGTTHDLGRGFMVIATQNPIEQEGTYPLPEAQLDRFLFKVTIGYPSRDEERRIVAHQSNNSHAADPKHLGVDAVMDLSMLVALREQVRSVRASNDILDYIVDLVRATRERPQLKFGASPRAAAMLANAARAHAALQGRDYVLPDDVKLLAVPGLRHRVGLSPTAEIDGLTVESVVQQILEIVPVPR
jgi:MoxR-like ATPase